MSSLRPRTAARQQLTAAAVVTAVCVVVATAWICYVLAHLGDPSVVTPRNELGILIYALPTAGAGMLLHAHRPGNPLGWVMLLYAVTLILPNAAAAPVTVQIDDPGVVGAAAVFQVLCDTVNSTLFYVLPLWLPAGRLTTRRWWWYIAAVALWVVPGSMSLLARPEVFDRPNPLADTPPARFFGTIEDHLYGYSDAVNYLLIGIAAVVLLVRLFQPAGPAAEQRQPAPRHRANVAAMLAAYLFWAGMQDFYRRMYREAYWLSYALFAAAGLAWAVAVGYLVIRDRGWRLDRAARSVLAGLLLATGITALFVVLAAVLSGWLAPGRGGPALVLIALVFTLGAGLPRATRWAVTLVDRLYYGERAQPYQVLRRLAGRVRQVVDPEALPAALCATVAEELRLPGVALTVSTRAGRRTLASVGRLDGREQGFTLVHHGREIGELTVALRDGEEHLDPSDIDILRSLADQASPAVASLRLQEDLQASREQIVAAREEERRWLRRDIHDGLGPALAGLRLRVDNAASAPASSAPTGSVASVASVASDGSDGSDTSVTAVTSGASRASGVDGDLSGTLRAISADLGMAIKEVRRITERLGPAPLGEFGLTRAVRQLAGTFSGAGLTVTADVSPDPLPELPAAVEVAVYRITAEALNNVLRHARARHARVTLRVDAEAVTLAVQDDGVGLREQTPWRDGDGDGGVGLRSMADRAAEIGGRCTVEPLPQHAGTEVLATLPRSPSRGRAVDGADSAHGE
ncbi:ATP-binding protein [Kitasatospora sp. NPDC093558]|uniref:sensor histidine kinase n=1 Tax=Kitasatospora sp. NPDC093558 TaxID=3155201 RepID=UPI0034133460